MKNDIITKFSLGVGDRFAHQARAQLKSIIKAKEAGLEIIPVWNKSHREHITIGSDPVQTRENVDSAVKELSWNGPYFLDADHVNLTNVDRFLDHCDFFTIDVADYIGQKSFDRERDAFIESNRRFTGEMELPGLKESFSITSALISDVADKYLYAVGEAARIYEYIAARKNPESIVIEISMDETDKPQTPPELFFILSAIAAAKIPVSTIAPKFSGRFNKGVDYVGPLHLFRVEFEQDLAVLQKARALFGMKRDLKLSIHSGSDKFSLYPLIREAVRKFDAGLHIKTAGTTWLEELIGLAEAGGEGLRISKKIYIKSLTKFEELCAPYASVIDIDESKLPSADDVDKWDGAFFVANLRHDTTNPSYNPHFRQLLHVGYKIAAELGDEYLNAIKYNADVIERNVVENLFSRHIKPLFLDK